MNSTLYLLRQQTDRIPLSLFQLNDPDKDVVLLKDAVSFAPSSGNGIVLDIAKEHLGGSRQMLTYDDLVEKIFASPHVIVI